MVARGFLHRSPVSPWVSELPKAAKSPLQRLVKRRLVKAGPLAFSAWGLHLGIGRLFWNGCI